MEAVDIEAIPQRVESKEYMGAGGRNGPDVDLYSLDIILLFIN